MFLYPSDWSHPEVLRRLERVGIKTKRVIKIYAATQANIRRVTERPVQIVPIEYSGLTHNDIFDYGDRGSYNGRDLEMYLQRYSGLDSTGIVIARAMLRFGYQEALGTNRLAMSLTNGNGKPAFENPFSFIHHFAAKRPDVNTRMHLDIYTPQSLEKLSKVIDLDPKKMATAQEVSRIRWLESGYPIGKERL